MKCKFVKPIYQNKEKGYCIFLYSTEDGSIPATARKKSGNGFQFTAVGNNLPDTDAIEVYLLGKWVKNRYGTQLQVEAYEEVLPQTKKGIEAYLASGMVRGIGPKTAKLIVDKFGTRTFEILDNYPQSLLDIKGITERKLEIILTSYRGSHVMRDLFGEEALNAVKNQPFSLCRINGFGFLTVDQIAKANRCRLNDPMRIEGCIYYCMELGVQEGHLFLKRQELHTKVYAQLNYGYEKEVVSEAEISQEIYRMVTEKALYYEEEAIYPAKLYRFECDAAKSIVKLMEQNAGTNVNMDFLIAEAPEKTTVQKVLLYIHEKLGGKFVLLTAPTGRASRRMSESTGRAEAVTMHSALGLTNDEECEATGEMLEADFIIADEFTMSDMRLSYEFFDHIKKGTRLVLVGDVNQLPSVGPGNVFRELVMCGVIPVTKLDMVFRQAENSRIAINAQKMQENSAMLDYGTGFEFYPAKSAEQAAQMIEKLYKEAVEEYGLDNVQVLSPFRKRGEASVDTLNQRLWNLINPMEEGKKEIKAGKHIFRVFDRIIHNKNKNQISNGDIGYVAGTILTTQMRMGIRGIMRGFIVEKFLNFS